MRKSGSAAPQSLLIHTGGSDQDRGRRPRALVARVSAASNSVTSEDDASGCQWTASVRRRDNKRDGEGGRRLSTKTMARFK